MSISSTKLTKLKIVIKFSNQPEVPFFQSLGPKPPQSEPQLQPYELIKRCQQVSNYNGCSPLFDKTDEQLYILEMNELEWHRKYTANTKQYRIGQRNTYYFATKRFMLIRRPHLDLK